MLTDALISAANVGRVRARETMALALESDLRTVIGGVRGDIVFFRSEMNDFKPAMTGRAR